jgi:hypothetical protein
MRLHTERIPETRVVPTRARTGALSDSPGDSLWGAPENRLEWCTAA